MDLEDSLGVNTDIFNLSFNKRKEQIEAGLRPSWKPDEHCFYRRLEDRSPSPSRRLRHTNLDHDKVSYPKVSHRKEAGQEPRVAVSGHPLSVRIVCQVRGLRCGLDTNNYKSSDIEAN